MKEVTVYAVDAVVGWFRVRRTTLYVRKQSADIMVRVIAS